ncbi:MAG: hypothetical protein ABIY55_14940 [Kofleriaceae bacterium]
MRRTSASRASGAAGTSHASSASNRATIAGGSSAAAATQSRCGAVKARLTATARSVSSAAERGQNARIAPGASLMPTIRPVPRATAVVVRDFTPHTRARSPTISRLAQGCGMTSCSRVSPGGSFQRATQ